MTDELPGITDMNERLTAFLRELTPSPAPPPRYRYFQKGNGNMYCWTVERAEQDKCAYCDGSGEVVGEFDYERCPTCRGRCYVGGWYASFVYKAKGRGARSGRAARWEFDQRSLVKHRKRKDAKGRALRLYRKATSSQ